MNKKIVVYSKRGGVKRLLPIDTNDLITLAKTIEENYPKEKEFTYVLIDGIEIKLF